MFNNIVLFLLNIKIRKIIVNKSNKIGKPNEEILIKVIENKINDEK